MPRVDVSEERRGQILDAAAAVFARAGVHQARIDDIVRAAELSKGAFYWYFKSKDELLAAFFDRVFAREIQTLRTFLESELAFAQRMRTVSRYIGAAIHEFGRLRGVALDYYALAARDPRVRRRVRGYLEQSIELFAAMIRDGIGRGECRRVDPDNTAYAIEAMYEGLMLVWIAGPERVDIAAMVDHATGLILESLAPAA